LKYPDEYMQELAQREPGYNITGKSIWVNLPKSTIKLFMS